MQDTYIIKAVIFKLVFKLKPDNFNIIAMVSV